MGLFTNAFFSVSGQKERLSNVVSVLGMALNPLDKGKVVANVENKTVKSVLEAAANNPYTTTALVVAPLASGTRGAIISGVTNLSTKTKVIASAAALVVGPALVTSEKARVVTVNTAASLTPEKLVKFGTQGGKLIDDPTWQGAKELVSENPVVVGAGAVLLALGLGTGAATSIANTWSLRQSTNATNELIDQGKKQAKDAAKNALEESTNKLTSKETPKAATALAGLAPASAVTDKPADVIAATPALATTPDKVQKPRAAGKRRAKRKQYKCARSRELHGRFNLRIS